HLEAERERRRRTDAGADAAVRLTGDRPVQAELSTPERFVPERLVAKGVAPLAILLGERVLTVLGVLVPVVFSGVVPTEGLIEHSDAVLAVGLHRIATGHGG